MIDATHITGTPENRVRRALQLCEGADVQTEVKITLTVGHLRVLEAAMRAVAEEWDSGRYFSRPEDLLLVFMEGILEG